MVRNNIQFMSPDRPINSILVTSAMPGEGKSTTAANLGVMLAQAGFRTIIVDADLRQPRQHEIFHISNKHGLIELLNMAKLDVTSALVQGPIEKLRLIPSGNLPAYFLKQTGTKFVDGVDEKSFVLVETGADAMSANPLGRPRATNSHKENLPMPAENNLTLSPSELLGSQRMRQVLADLLAYSDIVIVDSPSAIGVTETSVLSHQVDGVLLVIEANKTSRDVVQQAIANLRQVGANLLGAVLNKTSGSPSAIRA
jgi:Mrp family chromosome partitioning ATPase